LVERAGLEIFHYDVDLWDQRGNQRQPTRIAEVHTDAFLPEILLDVVEATVIAQLGDRAHEIAARRRLDLDHFGAHLREHTRAARSSERACQIQYAEACQDVLHCSHRFSPVGTAISALAERLLATRSLSYSSRRVQWRWRRGRPAPH